MKTIYIDSDFKCHLVDDGTMTAVETSAFDGMCDFYIKGYRFIPEGYTWTRSDGVTFTGEMVSPWKNYELLMAAQEQYKTDQAELEDMREALNVMGVST